MWQLIEEPGLRYFKFDFEDKQFLYSTIVGTEKFLERFAPVVLKQIHSSIVVNVDKEQAISGDGLMSNGLKPIGVKIADCLPVYLCDNEKIMVLHCGWRSIIKGIAKKAKGSLKGYKYCLGASIGSCCYEIKSDVAEVFHQQYPSTLIYKKNRIFLDLKSAVIEELGRESCIGNLDYCTYCHPEYFYSFRRGDKGKRNYAVLRVERV